MADGLRPRGDVRVVAHGRPTARRGVHGHGAHRHAGGARGVPPRRHPAVRRAAAGRSKQLADRRSDVNGTCDLRTGSAHVTSADVQRDQGKARELGFDLCGIAPADELSRARRSCASGSTAATRRRWPGCARSAERRADVRARRPRRAQRHRHRHALQHRPPVLDRAAGRRRAASRATRGATTTTTC